MHKQWTIQEIKQANQDAGLHWFEESSMRFFRTYIEDGVFQGPGGVFFVTRETNPSGITRWSVREFFPESGRVATAGQFHSYSSNRVARKEARLRAVGIASDGVVRTGEKR